MKKRNKIGRLTLPDFKAYYKATIIKEGWYKHKDKWNNILSPEIDPHICLLIFDKGITIPLEKDKWWESWSSIWKKKINVYMYKSEVKLDHGPK